MFKSYSSLYIVDISLFSGVWLGIFSYYSLLLTLLTAFFAVQKFFQNLVECDWSILRVSFHVIGILFRGCYICILGCFPSIAFSSLGFLLIFCIYFGLMFMQDERQESLFFPSPYFTSTIYLTHYLFFPVYISDTFCQRVSSGHCSLGIQLAPPFCPTSLHHFHTISC